MKPFIRTGYLLLAAFLAISCSQNYLPAKVEYNDYAITPQLPKDSGLVQWLKPYRDSVNNSMGSIVGIADKTLEKKRPEGSLGNFVADIMFNAGQQMFGVPIDAAFVNYGALRITQIPKGPVTLGKIFELMPFDNLIVLQKIKGDVLQQFLDFTAQTGGWPSAGITMQIKNGKAVNVKIGGSPIDFNKVYNVINSDFVANGGDNAVMLKTIKQQIAGYMMRDAILDHIQKLKTEGKNISANEENRVTNVE